MKWYVGFDWRDSTALEVFLRSLQKHSSINFGVVPLVERKLRRQGLYWRSYHVDGDGQMWDDRDGKPFSSDFSFTRFAVPILEADSDDLVIYSDPDILVRSDPAEMIEAIDRSMVVSCVHHDHAPPESDKMDGVRQTQYFRKNWSSLMVFRPSLCKNLTKYAINNRAGQYLHALLWAEDGQIGKIEEKWNWLEGWSDAGIDPAIVHFTRGTPDMTGHEDAAFAEEWRETMKTLPYYRAA